MVQRDIHLPASILQCRAVSREFQFSSREMLNGLRLEQRIFFQGGCMEGATARPRPRAVRPHAHSRRAAPPRRAEWNFQFGFVIPNSTNTWQQTIHAADESKMIPASLLKCGAPFAAPEGCSPP